MNRLLPFEWIVAMRFMREGTVQSLLIIAGVGLGIGVIVFMSAALAGLQDNVVRRTLNFVAPIVVIAPDQVARPLRSQADETAALVQPRSQQLRSIDQWQKARAQIEHLPGVVAVTPIAGGPGFALRGDASKSVSIIGIETDTYLRVIALGEKIVDGRVETGPTGILIGTDLSKDLGAGVGDKLSITTASGAAQTLNVTGVFDFGNKGANQRNVYVSLRSAQSLLDLVGGVTSLEIKVQDPFEAERVAQAVQAHTGQQADSWIKTNAQFFTAMNAQILTNTLIRIFVGLTVALGISSVLVVAVVQKSKEIGILRAMGTSRGQVLRLFLLQGAVMGLVGSTLGSLLAGAFVVLFRSLVRNTDGTPLFVIALDTKLLVATAIGATLVGVLSAMIPARRAAALDPAVAIRG